MKEPKYYLAVFGKPELPDKDTVDSGKFYLGKRGTDTPGERGDIMLLYCTDSDTDYFKSVRGIGVILTRVREFIFYRYLPLSSLISKDKLENAFTGDDKNKLTSIRSNTYWLYDISNESFVNATRGVLINWP